MISINEGDQIRPKSVLELAAVRPHRLPGSTFFPIPVHRVIGAPYRVKINARPRPTGDDHRSLVYFLGLN